MKVLKFKTNINCSNCVRSVSGFLDELKSIQQWHVDTEDPRKVLTVEGADIRSGEVIAAVEEAGFEITKMGMWKN